MPDGPEKIYLDPNHLKKLKDILSIKQSQLDKLKKEIYKTNLEESQLLDQEARSKSLDTAEELAN